MMSLPRSRVKNRRTVAGGALFAPVCRVAYVVASLGAFFVGEEARAQGSAIQGVPNAMQGFSQNRNKPIQIDAGSLELRDKDKAATFKDNVKVVQGDTTMSCKTLVVFYEGGASPSGSLGAASAQKPTMTATAPGPGGSSGIRRLEAKGNVVVTQKDQTVTGDTGEFDMKSNTITMRGHVVLTKGENVLRGDRLVVDMATGVSRVESNSGRVQGLFQSSGKGGGTTSLFPGSNSNNESAGSAPPPSGPGAAGKPINLNNLGTGKR